MDINKFPNPRLNIPKELKDSGDESMMRTFQEVDAYLYSIREYIYTDIDLNHLPSGESHTHAWVQRALSEGLLRSLYIRNAFVDAFNARNPVGMFLSLKAWTEVVGYLAAILDLLEQQLPQEEMRERFKPLVLGNRGKGALRVGKTDAVNVLTMMNKADKYLTKMANSLDGKNEIETFFSDYYDIASNPTHPSFDAHGIVGGLDSERKKWVARTPDEIRSVIVSDIPGYGALLMAPLFIANIAKKILEIEKEHFVKLGSNKYFS